MQVLVLVMTSALAAAPHDRLPGTDPLVLDGDLASRLVDGVDRFLLRALAGAGTFTFLHRHLRWPEPTSASPRSP